MIRVAAVLACVGVAAAVCAQESPSALKERVSALEARVADLQQERDALRVRLSEAIEMLRNLGYAPPPPVLAEPEDPMASPLAAMQTLRQRARLELAPIPRDTAEALASYREAAQAWVDKMNAALGGEKQWLVRVIDVTLPTTSSSAARAMARVQLFDSASGAPLSLPMEVSVPARVGRRMAEAGTDAGWTAHVKLEPNVRHNPTRQERGPFDHPPFLAPEVEATVGVNWLRFEPADVPQGFFPPLAGEGALTRPSQREPAAEQPAPSRQPR